MEFGRVEFSLEPNDFNLLERITEKIGNDLFINDSYYAGINVSVEQFFNWLFENDYHGKAVFSIHFNSKKIIIHWIFDEKIYNEIKLNFSESENLSYGIIMKIVDKIYFDDKNSTILFNFEMTNNFEKIYTTRASVLAGYFKKNRISSKVDHDSF